MFMINYSQGRGIITITKPYRASTLHALILESVPCALREA